MFLQFDYKIIIRLTLASYLTYVLINVPLVSLKMKKLIDTLTYRYNKKNCEKGDFCILEIEDSSYL